MKNILKVAAVQCPKCLDIIFSRAHHDYRRCSCGETAIDGGREYIRTSFKTGSAPPTHVHVELVGITENELYRDWNHDGRQFGLIKTVKVAYNTLYRYTYNKAGKLYRYAK